MSRGNPAPADLGTLPLRNWREDGPCPNDADGHHRYVEEWSDGRGDNAGTCAKCGKRARWDSSD